MQEFKEAQAGLDALFEQLKYDRRTGATTENRKERRAREKAERRAGKPAAKQEDAPA